MRHLKIIKPVLLIPLVCLTLLLYYNQASAVIVTNRSLNLASPVAASSTSHTISFNFQTTNSVGSIVFQYCTSPIQSVACTAPTGIDASAATLSSQSGETGFIIFSQTANSITLGRVPKTTGTQLNSYTLKNVKNPTAIGSFYLRISSYASSDGSGPVLDFGSTVGVITQAVTITSDVAQILNFCVGVSIPNLCDSASGNFLNLGSMKSSATAFGTTQFLVGTNANFGYAVTVNGNTMTSGNNTVAPLSTPTASKVGQAQFGINLRVNTQPAVGADPSGGSGAPTADYNSSNLFTFNNGAVVASHNFVSDNERYTVSYIVNVDSTQPAGFYNTTLTYSCSATF